MYGGITHPVNQKSLSTDTIYIKKDVLSLFVCMCVFLRLLGKYIARRH